MALTFLGKDPASPVNDSPTIYDNGDTYVIQGWKIVDPAVLADVGGCLSTRLSSRSPSG